MKHVLLALCILFLAACSISNGENKGGALPGGGTAQPDQSGQSAPVKNETNYSACGGSTHRANIDGSWQMQQSQGELTFVMTMTFRNGSSVLFTNDCSVRGRTLRAQVSAPASYQNGRISVYANATHTEKIEEPSFNMNCTATLTRASMTYSFNGDCLALRGEDGAEIVLTPVEHP